MTVDALTLAEATRIVREATRDKTYQLSPIGQDVAEYLRYKGKRLTPASLRDYESSLEKLARHFADLRLEDMEPPVGMVRLEEFLEHQWGGAAQRTYNKNLSYVRDFFKFWHRRGRLQGDPCVGIERAKARAVHREVFRDDDRLNILANNPDRRDRVALRLLFDYGLRKGALRKVQFQHFDHVRKRLTVFTKGGKVQNVPIPSPEFWHDLERLILDTQAEPNHYLLPRITRANKDFTETDPTQPMGEHGAHNWWYRCLRRAGVVDLGVTRGERMHKARHTAGQRLFDATRNIKAVQQFLGHESIQTTVDIYLGWDEDALAVSIAQMLAAEANVPTEGENG